MEGGRERGKEREERKEGGREGGKEERSTYLIRGGASAGGDGSAEEGSEVHHGLSLKAGIQKPFQGLQEGGREGGREGGVLIRR